MKKACHITLYLLTLQSYLLIIIRPGGAKKCVQWNLSTIIMARIRTTPRAFWNNIVPSYGGGVHHSLFEIRELVRMSMNSYSKKGQGIPHIFWIWEEWKYFSFWMCVSLELFYYFMVGTPVAGSRKKKDHGTWDKKGAIRITKICPMNSSYR